MSRPLPPPTSCEAPNAGSGWSSPPPPPQSLPDRIFREDLLDPLERLFRRRLRCHPAGNDVGPGDGPDMLVLDLGIGRVGGPEGRYGRPERALLPVRPPGGVFGVGPPGVVLDDRRHRRQVPAEPRLQILVKNL